MPRPAKSTGGTPAPYGCKGVYEALAATQGISPAQLSTLEQMTSLNAGIEVLHLIQATGFVGKSVEALTSDGSYVVGTVSEVKFTESEPLLIVEGTTIRLDDVIGVFAADSETE